MATALPHLELASCPVDPVPITAIHHINECVSVIEVVPPQGPQLFLPTHVPHREYHILVLDLFHVETCTDVMAARAPGWVWSARPVS
jgi:hypothetical protein